MKIQGKGIVGPISLLITQAFVTPVMWLTSRAMALHWNGVLAGEQLPRATAFGFQSWPLLPIAVAAMLVVVIWAKSRGNESATGWIVPICILEIVALALFSLVTVLPGFITHLTMGD
ncbi:MAG: hypothetical protein HQ559_00670 [Lentisphaerae bacterium]|nr:hypothetical protein [Lentisphaerota bacterium]